MKVIYELCPCHLRENYYQAITRGFLEEIWSLSARILPSPRRCLVCCEILDPLGHANRQVKTRQSPFSLWDLAGFGRG